MLKLFEILTNDGGWNGCNHEWVVAKTKEEALEKSRYSKNRIKCGCDYVITDHTGDSLLETLLLSNYEKGKYDVTLTITEKEDK